MFGAFEGKHVARALIGFGTVLLGQTRTCRAAVQVRLALKGRRFSEDVKGEHGRLLNQIA